MAELTGWLVAPSIGGYVNQRITSALDHYQHIVAPTAAILPGYPGQAPLARQWPINANPRAITGIRARCYADDFYHRIHWLPKSIDFGNVVSEQVATVTLWNAHLEPRTLTTITGQEEGLSVAGQPAPPMTIAGLKELDWLVSMSTDGPSIVNTTLGWHFDNDEVPNVLVTATRIISWTFLPDWSDPVVEKLEWKTDILQSESMVEQRRALRTVPRRELALHVPVTGSARQMLDLALFAWGTRTWMLPIYPDIQFLSAPLAGGSLRIPCETTHYDFHAGGAALLMGDDPRVSEVVTVADVDSTGIDLLRPTQRAWPAVTRLYPCRPARLTTEPELERLTDSVMRLDTRFLFVEPSLWLESLPGVLYRGRPVLTMRPDESQSLSRMNARLVATLDNQSAIPQLTDIGGLSMPVTGFRWIGLGRAERAAFRSLVYALRGQQGTLWIPTWADDLKVVAAIGSGATTVDVENVGYSRFGRQRPGRRDIQIVLQDGSVFYRRIVDSGEQSETIDRLVIDEALGVNVDPADIQRVSFIVLSRLASDTVELEHMTDSAGVARSALTFRGVRDDEF